MTHDPQMVERVEPIPYDPMVQCVALSIRLADKVGATYIDLATAALEASHHAELVEALDELEMAVAAYRHEPTPANLTDLAQAQAKARSLLTKVGVQ